MTDVRPYKQTARAAAQERTRAALLDAAEAAFFGGPGWEQVPLEAIAADAGVTKQTLLRHFGSKDGLLEQTHQRAYERVREQRDAAPVGDVEGAVDNLLEHYAEHGLRALVLGAHDPGGPMGAVLARARELHYDWVRRAFAPWLDATRDDAQRDRLHAGLVVLCDVHAWAILARDLALPAPEVRATLIQSIRRLLREET